AGHVPNTHIVDDAIEKFVRTRHERCSDGVAPASGYDNWACLRGCANLDAIAVDNLLSAIVGRGNVMPLAVIEIARLNWHLQFLVRTICCLQAKGQQGAIVLKGKQPV